LKLLKKPDTWQYLDIEASGVTRDLCLNCCWENDATGVVEDVPAHGYVRVFFIDKKSSDSAIASMKTSIDMFDDTFVSKGQIADPGWRLAWHDYFKSAPAGNRFLISPSWEKKIETDRIQLFIHPGQTFGTGQHESTHLVLKLMEHIDFEGKTVFDAGCGSGVLGIAASYLGALSVFGLDNEPVDEAINNSALNGTEAQCRWLCGDIRSENSQYDVVLANINIGFITCYHRYLVNCVQAEGNLIVSGFLLEDFNLVEGLFAGDNLFKVIKQENMGEWAAALLVRLA